MTHTRQHINHYALRTELFRQARKNAKGLTGAQVLTALERAGDVVFDSGADHALQRIKPGNLDNVASAWDCGWLTVLLSELRKVK